jgi:NCS1 family nucleobase:cation symporter-1
MALALRWPNLTRGPEWGIEPVPGESRTLGTFDNAVLWGNLGFSLLLLVTGSFLVPAMGLGQALLAILVGALIGNVLLAVAAVIGAETGLPAMVLYRAPLGIRGSYVASVATLVRNVAWGTLALVLVAEVATTLSERGLGWGARPVWVIVFGGLGTLMAVLGPIDIVRKWFRRFWFWFVLLVAVVVGLSGYMEFGVPAMLQRDPSGGWPSFWQGVDLVIALPVAWLPLAADYSRFAKAPRSAFIGTFAGSFIATFWFCALGVLYLPAVNAEDLVGWLLGGMPIGLMALLVALMMESDGAFANVYSASVSAQNVAPEASRRGLAVAVGAVAVLLALVVDVLHYENVLLLIGSLFVPLFGILAADYFLVRRRRLDTAALYRSDGGFWYRGGVNGAALVVWLAGFLLYNWISPGTVGWWVNLMDALFGGLLRLPFPLGSELTWLGASIPAFLATFVLYAVVGTWTNRRNPAPVERAGDAG